MTEQKPSASFPALFEPITIGSTRSRNRIMLLPHAAGFMREGYPTIEYAKYLGEIAQLSAGMVVKGGSSAHEASWVHKGEVRLFEDDIVSALQPISEAVHAAGSLFIIQLSHLGREARSFRPWFPLLAPTAQPSPRIGEVPVELTQALIDEVRRSFVRSARHALASGADGVEVQVAHGYLMNEFLSPWSNQRGDEYGGKLANRMRFLQEILEDIRTLNPSILGIRVPAGEEFDQGISWQDVISVIRSLDVNKLIDYVTVSVPNRPGQHIKDSAFAAGSLRNFTRELKRTVRVPVIISQRIDSPEVAHDVLASGDADLVGLARGLIADPAWGEKAKLGHPEQIRPCIACLQDCRRGSSHEPIGCAVNPAFGLGSEPLRAGRPQSTRVVVVGAGPAGCEAALSLARNGVSVVVFEAAPRAGGRARLAGLAPNRATWITYADYLHAALTAHDSIDARFGMEATVADIMAERPSAVVLATGAVPVRQINVTPTPWLSPDDVLAEGAITTWRHVLVVDEAGGWDAANAVEAVVARGGAVTYVTRLERVGHRVPEESRADLLSRLRLAEVPCYTSAVVRWRGQRATVDQPLSRSRMRLTPDAVIWAGPTASRHELLSPLLLQGLQVMAIGDALAPRGLSMATQEGWQTGPHLAGVINAPVLAFEA